MKFELGSKSILISETDACYKHLKSTSISVEELDSKIQELYDHSNDMQIRFEIAQLLIWHKKIQSPFLDLSSYQTQLNTLKSEHTNKPNSLLGKFEKIFKSEESSYDVLSYIPNANNFENIIQSIRYPEKASKKPSSAKKTTKNVDFFSDSQSKFSVTFADGFFYITGNQTDLNNMHLNLISAKKDSILNSKGLMTTASIKDFENFVKHDRVNALTELMHEAIEAYSSKQCKIS